MKIPFNSKLISFAQKLNKPLYAVGGYVRNFLISGEASRDIDLASPMPAQELAVLAQDAGFEIRAIYERTGTVLFSDGTQNYEYTAFRKDSYFGFGEHTPTSTEHTEHIEEDALRRDFRCNAVYYDIAKGKIVDTVGGVEDIKNRVLCTVRNADITFHEDGLRLLRLARFAGELGFTPSAQTLEGAKKNADAILPISAERIYAELKMILHADKKYKFSKPEGHYISLKILDDTRVLDRIIPELTLGRGMAQRADYHIYDVLEHSLRCVLYADESIRLPALLHDVGKPYCMKNFGKYHGHDKAGETIAREVLKRLKADKKTTEEVLRLTLLHMYDMEGAVRENKLKKIIIQNKDIFDKILLLKQADYLAGGKFTDTAPAVIRWGELYRKMVDEGTPLSVSELKISASQLIEMGYSGKEIGRELEKLFDYAVENPSKNKTEKLLEIAKADFLKGK